MTTTITTITSKQTNKQTNKPNKQKAQQARKNERKHTNKYECKHRQQEQQQEQEQGQVSPGAHTSTRKRSLLPNTTCNWHSGLFFPRGVHWMSARGGVLWTPPPNSAISPGGRGGCLGAFANPLYNSYRTCASTTTCPNPNMQQQQQQQQQP